MRLSDFLKLTCSPLLQLEFYTKFLSTHPDVKCSLSSFEALKPWWMKRLRIWNTCCCRYHQELMELLNALDIMRTDKQGVHFNCTCHCDMVCGGVGCEHTFTMCDAHKLKYERLTALWTSILCPIDEFSMWHKRDCLMGNCVDCGLQLLRVCPLELSSEKMVKWKSIGYKTVGTTEEGNPRKASMLEYRETVPRELIEYLKPKLRAFVLHNYIASWQDYQFREMFGSVPPSTLISCVDFSENYTLKVQNEIQSMHWHNDQITILVHITYKLNPDWHAENDEPLLLKEFHYYVSDDKTHDSLFVQHCFMLNWDHVKSQGFMPENHIVWSDGCSGQFKSARAWYFISHYPNLTSSATMREGCQIVWNYFASGHGKGEVDGAGALMTREIQTEQMKPNGEKLQNAQEIVSFLRRRVQRVHASSQGARASTNKYFWLILMSGPGSVDRVDGKEADRVPDSMANHQARSVSARDPTLIQYRQLTCLCYFCSGYQHAHGCHQLEHVQGWLLHRLKPQVPTQVRRLYDQNDEVEPGSGREWIAHELCVGDNVAVQAPSDDEPFWLMMVQQATHIVLETFTDVDGNVYVPRDVVFRV